MDQGRWDTILGKIGTTRSQWRLLSKELSGAKKDFISGSGTDWKSVQKLRETWRSTSPFVDSDGNPFVLYIYDQAGANYRYGWGRYGRSSLSPREYKFHFSWCQALETMSSYGRRARYKAKYDVDNDIFIVNRGGDSDEQTQMRVCRFCLSGMSYQGYSHSSTEQKKNEIYNNFEIGFFFQQNIPLGLTVPTHQYHSGRYTSDWPEISKRIRDQRGNRCEGSGPHSGNLHVHHINGVKSDNRPQNLKVFCYSCHAAQPMHGHMR